MSFYGYRPYVPVAKRRENAAKALAKLNKKSGITAQPVVITGRAIASSFWGKSWCANLERYSDYASRLPRGRTYARNGSVVDLRITPGNIEARVSGSELYTVSATIQPLPAARWKALCADCAGGVDSLVELLQGRFSKAVMERMCQDKKGLFPAPAEIKFDCSCPDWAGMCKHVAAVFYGIGARLDQSPELLFTLRQVDPLALLAHATQHLEQQPLGGNAPKSSKRLAAPGLAALFNLELAEPVAVPKKTMAKKVVAKVAVKKAVPKKPAAKVPAKKVAPVKVAASKPTPAKKSPIKKPGSY
jgi:uncharacterized Zn finger protein